MSEVVPCPTALSHTNTDSTRHVNRTATGGEFTAKENVPLAMNPDGLYAMMEKTLMPRAIAVPEMIRVLLSNASHGTADSG